MKQSHAALSRRMKRYIGDVHAIQKEFSRSWSGSQYDYRWAISHLGKRKKTTRRKILEFLRREIILFPPPERPTHWLEDVFIWNNVPDDDIKRARPHDPLAFNAGTVTADVRFNYIQNNKQVLRHVNVQWDWDGKGGASIWYYRFHRAVRASIGNDSPTGLVIELFRCTIKENQNAGVIHTGAASRDSNKGKELSGKPVRQRNKKHHGKRKGGVS